MKPNQSATEVLHRAATEYDKVAAAHEVAADLIRTMADAMRRADVEAMIDLSGRLRKLDLTDRKAADIMRLLETADERFYEYVKDMRVAADIMSLDFGNLVAAMLLHSATCSDRTCELHVRIEKRFKELYEK